MSARVIDPWLRDRLVCPRDHGALTDCDGTLRCADGHVYPIVDGVPVMLIGDVPNASLALASGSARLPWLTGLADSVYVEATKA